MFITGIFKVRVDPNIGFPFVAISLAKQRSDLAIYDCRSIERFFALATSVDDEKYWRYIEAIDTA